MSTDNNSPMMNFDSMDEDQVKEYVMRFHSRNNRNRESLELKEQKKREREQKIQENLFTKMSTGELSAAPVTAPIETTVQPLLEKQADMPFVKVKTLSNVGTGAASPPKAVVPTEPIVVTQQLNRETPKASTPVNDENEPTGIQWRPTTVQQLIALYPKAQAVSDLYMVLHGAAQQPGMAFGLLAPHGTKYFVKSDKTGNLFMADPDSNPKAFANVGLNPDFDEDSIDDKTGVAPAKPFQTNSHRVLPTRLESKATEFGVEDVNFSEALEESRIPLEKIEDKKTRDVIERLYKEADELRKKAEEEKTDKLTEAIKEGSISLKKLNKMLMQAQTRINTPQGDIFEAVADELSGLIAEALLTNKDSVSVNRISPIIRKIKW
jgi:hypothetical protein